MTYSNARPAGSYILLQLQKHTKNSLLLLYLEPAAHYVKMRSTKKAPKCTGSGRKVVILTQAISRVVFFCRTHRKTLVFIHAAVCAVLASALPPPLLAANTIVRMETNVGAFNIELYDTEAPLTVANFLNYVNRGDYGNTVIHRSAVAGDPPVPFIIQGGGYVYGNVFGVEFFFDFPKDPPVQNEFSPSRSNVRGTIAMAKIGGDPDSATSEWFFNLGDNSANLDNQNGGFTVFGHVIGPGMEIVDAIADLQIQARVISMTDGSQIYFGELPITSSNSFVLVRRICINNDGDGACPETEDLAPGADGNADGIADRDQSNVTTILTTLSGTATFSSDTAMKFDSAEIVNVSAALSLLSAFEPPPNQSAHFNNDIFTLTMTGIMGGVGHIVTLYDNASTRPTHYYAYGPTPDDPSPHWYDFAFDGETGAEIKNDRIILHFVDGMRGDDDLTVNDSITHTGAQAVVTAVDDGSAQGGGCSIAGIPPNMTRGGDWIVVSLFLTMLLLVRRRARRHVQRERVTNIASP
jgi:cyclophilin family peptidyl-prolyl cis-trans isomerase